MAVDRYRVNDALTALAAECGVEMPDEQLNELTHHVADEIDKAMDAPPDAESSNVLYPPEEER